MYRFVEIITIIQLAIGVLQYIISLGVIPRLFIINELLYNDHGEVTYYYSSFRRVLSTYQEPSFYACFLVGAFFFFLSSKVRNKKRTIIMVLSIIEIILTFSSTAYGALAIIGILYICLNATSRRGIFLAAAGSVVALIMFIFSNRFSMMLFLTRLHRDRPPHGECGTIFRLWILNLHRL